MQTTGTITAVMEREMREAAGIDLQTYDVLLHTFESGEVGARMVDLATQIAFSKAGLTALIDRLEKQRLVRRTPDPSDRRVIRITITPKGEKLFRAAAKVHVDGINEHVAQHLTDEQAQVIAEALEHVRRRHTEELRRSP
jgi:DNA-binding MarR family transcriptional regulator